MLNAPLRILIVAALAIAALIGIVVREGMARDSGREVILLMQAVDPRSLLQGHYVIVSLQQSLQPNQACPQQAPDAGWIALTPAGDEAHFAGAGRTQDEALQQGPIAVRGTVFCTEPQAATEHSQASPGQVTLDLGVERFHTSQAEAERIERLMRESDREAPSPVAAILSVGADGRARLKGLRVNGQRLELSWL